MMNTSRRALVAAGALAAVFNASSPALAAAAEETKRGEQAFLACVACHSLEPGRHLTGPSLASVLGRKAGSVAGFLRYSDALKRSGVAWDEKTLDAWLKDPNQFIPGNEMTFPGIKDDKARRGLIAYLKAADTIPAAQRVRGPRMANLKKARPESIVRTIRHCGDTYFVTTEDGKTEKIWEFNFRIKTDTSDSGPVPGKPVYLGVGMRGDRTAVIFAAPVEFGSFIKENCG